MMINSQKSQWREKFIYPLLGIASIAAILFLNFSDQLQFPILLWPQKPMDFVGVNSTQFVIIDGGQQSAVYINGWNSYWLMEASVWGPSRSKVSKMLKKGAQMGLTVCRTWAFSDGPGPNSLQISPGVFNQRVFKALDYVIVEARKNGIRLILSLVNNLNAFGGKAQYVRWAEEVGVNLSSSADSFFSDPTIKGYYKDYVKAWITEMAAYIKSLDQKHLVTIGLEGFYGPSSMEKSGVNPGDWASSLGTDFIQNSAVDGIDFASVHAYPDSWMPHANASAKMDFISQWLDSHISDGESILKKPVLVTEVGFPLHVKNQGLYDRDTLLQVVYDKIFESDKKGKAGAGALVWQLLVEGMEEYGDRFSLVAWKHPSTYKLILEQSCRLRNAFWNKKSTTKLNGQNPCSGLVS